MTNEQYYLVPGRLPESHPTTAFVDEAYDFLVKRIGTPIPPCADVETVCWITPGRIAFLRDQRINPKAAYASAGATPISTEPYDVPLVRRTDMEAQAEVSEALIRDLKSEIAGYRKALNDISENITCGCMPCMGNCWDKDSLRDEISERAEIARTALKEGSAA
ncbi:hypothetical protein LDL36_13760 [Komagataeibacter sp. FNDCR1]|nr:hypothetical protein [Komagataeibacter sp. FNDCR1]